jgi:phospholipid/cholesterol/gamma-HCH transport system permease protein
MATAQTFARTETPAGMSVTATGDVLTVSFSGDWILGAALPSGPEAVRQAEAKGAVRRVVLSGQMLGRWDSGLLLTVSALSKWCREKNLALDTTAIPEGASGLLHLASAVAERKGARRESAREGFLTRLGRGSLKAWKENIESLAFLGDITLSLGRFFSGRARYRRADLWLIIEQCGPQALGIVTTISTLVGAILAFVGAIQLAMFGAEIYVANLVGLGMVIEMGALMTGIILAGRTGAAFAAQLGTMQVNEEIDALKTLGIPPMDYLVLPRMVALAIMTPLLVIYADVLGILGGAAVGIFLLDIPPVLFFNQTTQMMTVWFCAQGLIKGSTFGVLVALAGCLRGMQCGRSASAVGDAATSAVVTSIVLIVLADAVWTFLFMIFQ